MKEQRKERLKQKELNEIRAGKFEIIKNTKNIKKWSKKIKSQLVKLPAEMFENLLKKRWSFLTLLFIHQSNLYTYTRNAQLMIVWSIKKD